MIYEFGWYDWEDHNRYTLEHESKTQAEFWKDCKEAMRKAAEQAMKFQDPTDQISIESLYGEAFNILISQFGYKEPNIIVGPFGNICVREDRDRDSRWALGTRLLEKLKEHNSRAERLYEDRWK